MKKIIFLLFVCFSLLSCSYNDTNKVMYRISNTIKDSIPLIKVNMKFKPDYGEFTKLRFQDKAWGEEDLYNSIQEMKLLDVKGTIVKNKDSNWIQITHPKGLKEIHFEYTLKQDFSVDEASQNTYRPIINKDYFHIFSHNMFMLPDHYLSEIKDPFDVTLDWNNFPEDYTIHNSFGSENRIQQIKEITEEEFHSAIFVGGDFRIYTKEIENNQLVLATRGDWIPFTDAAVSDLLYTTVKAQRSFWKDHSQQYFTVTMMPFSQKKGSSYGGTGLTNSFATAVSNNDQTGIEQLRYLFNHELMHNWIGLTIKNENEEKEYWFSEGFTDYYTQKNIAKNKILASDEENFIEEMNSTIKNLFSSPVADKPNNAITYDKFWSDRNYEKLPYYRGTVFAFILDLRIKKDSGNKHSLDDVMRDLLTQSKKDKKLNATLFVETVNKYTKTPVNSFFEKHIIEGELFDLSEIFNDFNLDYSSKAKVFDQGFSFDEETRIVTQVTPNSAAYTAGLRVDDVLGGWSMYYGDIEKEVEIIVNRKKGVQETITYLPVKEIVLPQLSINKDNVEKINL